MNANSATFFDKEPSLDQPCDGFEYPHEQRMTCIGGNGSRRADKSCHNFVRWLSKTWAFNAVVMITILLNSVIMMLEVNDSYAPLQQYYQTFDMVFLTIYSLEFLVKVYAEPIDYWKSAWNRFDFLILVASCFQVFFDDHSLQDSDKKNWAGALPILRTLRATRAIRAMRAISFVRGLQVLLTALLDTMKKSFINVMLILIFLMYIFAIFGYYMFGADGGDEANWGNLGVAFLTLFSFVTVDGWFDAQLEMDSKIATWSRIYTILFVSAGHFLIFNIFIGVNIMNIHEANETFQEQVIGEKEAILTKKKEHILQSQLEDVRKLQEKQAEKEFGNFYEMVKPYQDSLRNEDYTIMEDNVSDPKWLQLYLEMLDWVDETTFG